MAQAYGENLGVMIQCRPSSQIHVWLRGRESGQRFKAVVIGVEDVKTIYAAALNRAVFLPRFRFLL